MHLNRKTVEMSFKWNFFYWKLGVGLNIYDSEMNLDPRGTSAPTQGQYTCLLYDKKILSPD